MSTTAQCQHCGMELEPTHIDPCPNCGKQGKNVQVVLNEIVHLSDEVLVTKTHEFYAKNFKITVLLILMFVVSPILGLFFGGTTGLVLGVILGGLGFVLSPHAILKTRTIEHL